ncbi:putative porin [Microbacter margulisiae]|uniref:Porin n=1 Tax=Microbacter margulisiae TaxID=1350067 RepID=A0A7W5DQ63_9PORP|nr:putative porin [Microbacter margulisiae]MBB3186931.1 hypothetical protein [Microbacter margulisiae]
MQNRRSGNISDNRSSQQKSVYVAPDVKTWKIDSRFGVADTVAVDTIPLNFQDDNPVDRYSIANSYNGNLASPLQSKIFFDRTQKTDFLFGIPYDAYFRDPSDFYFFNTKTPYTNFGYQTGSSAQQAEDHVNVLFSMNDGKRLNITGLFDYIYARGQYSSQSAKALVASLYGSYTSNHYNASGILAYQKFDNKENGGLTDDRYVTNPTYTGQYTTINMPVNLSGAQSGYENVFFYYNQSYSLGFTKTIHLKNDSVRKEFIPVTTFIHTLNYSLGSKRFHETSVDTSFFANTYLSNTSHSDTASEMSLKNTFAVRLDEKFNRLFHFGLTAFIESNYQRYMMLNDSDRLSYASEYNTTIGGKLSKYEGRIYKYDFEGDMIIEGPRIGDFHLKGNIGGFFRLGKDSVVLRARGRIQSVSPSYFWDHYYSNHFIWNNHFANTFQSYVGGDLSLPKHHLFLGLQMANTKNMLYFNSSALPAQFSGNIQVVAANAELDLHAGPFVLANKGVYQICSNQSILPLPTWSMFHNLYFTTTLFKDLNTQIGTSVSYNSSYYAPDYMPATEQFYLQHQIKLGAYPLINVYANFHLKQIRIFVKYYNLGTMFLPNTNYFSIPHYPLNPMTFKFGFSWNFYS